MSILLICYSCYKKNDSENVSSGAYNSISHNDTLYIIDDEIADKQVVDQYLRNNTIDEKGVIQGSKELISTYGEKARNGLYIYESTNQ